MQSKIRKTMCKRCSCLGVLGQLVRYHKGEELNEIELLSVREVLEGRGEYGNDLFRCYMDQKDEIKCRGLKLAFDYIDKHNLTWNYETL